MVIKPVFFYLKINFNTKLIAKADNRCYNKLVKIGKEFKKMSKLCKRILLILAVFSSFLTLFACSAIQIDTYHVELPQDKYQLRVGQEIEALPIVSKNGQECDLEVSYHSYDASIATYVDGKIVALKSGECL